MLPWSFENRVEENAKRDGLPKRLMLDDGMFGINQCEKGIAHSPAECLLPQCFGARCMDG
jgi:hypothetical protein